MNTEQLVLEGIDNGFDDSRTLAKEIDMSQEYIRRIVTKLSDEGKVKINKAPRGYTYEVV